MSFVTQEAPKRIELQACIQCGLCLPFCPTYRITMNEMYSPRGRLAAMSAVLDGIATVDEAFDDALSTCLGCRACEAVCPSLVPYGRVFEGARAELAEQRPTPGRRLRGLVLGRGLGSRAAVRVFTIGAALAQRLPVEGLLPPFARRGLQGMRPIEWGRRPWVGRTAKAIGPRRGTAALLSGCVMDAWFGPVHDATVGVLRRAGYEVVVPESQTCCGALAAHDGQVSEAKRLASDNLSAFDGADVIISDSAGCSAHLKEYQHWTEGGSGVATRVKDVTEFVAGLIAEGVLPTFDQIGEDVAMQDPCHLRHAQRIMAPPRAIVRAAGYRPVEIDPDGICCGAAGIYSVLQPATSSELGERKAAQVRGSGAAHVASANPGCEMQLRAYLGESYQVEHPVELYWRALTAADR